MLTTKEIATQFSVSTRTVRNWIENGELKGYKFGKDYRIEPEDVEKFKQQKVVNADKA